MVNIYTQRVKFVIMSDSNIYKDNFKYGVFLIDGISIFIPKEQVAVSDEYGQNDPYNVENNINKPFQKRRIDITLEFLSKCVNKNSKVLDLGCGEGHITNEFSKYVYSENIFACDYSISAIKKAKNNFPGIDFCVSDVYSLPYKNNIFDVVVCNNIFEHLENPLLALEEIKRIMKKQGYLIISTPSRYRFENFLRLVLGKKMELMSKFHVTEYTVGQMVELLNFSGFMLVECKSYYISCESRPIIKNILNFFKLVLSAITKIFRSSHIWESTAFYLFKENG